MMDSLLDFLNRFWIDGVVIVAYAAILYAVYLIRINHYKLDRDWHVFRTQIQAKEILAKSNELNKLGQLLDKAMTEVIKNRDINAFIQAELEKKNRAVNELHAEANFLLVNNKETLKENKLQVYNVREATLNLYRQYKEMADLFRHLLVFDDGASGIFKHLRNALEIANKGVESTTRYFKLYFRMTPAQYIEKKEYIVGKKSNGSDHVTDCSVN